MESYLNKLISQYKVQSKIDFDKISTITSEHLINLENNFTSVSEIKSYLESIVVLKLNGGLGTSMGCTGPKSMIVVKDGLNFIDIICLQIIELNSRYDVDIPLVFMNSMNTDKATIEYCKKYNTRMNIYHFNQNFLPRMNTNLEPLASEYNENNKKYFYPPGHGDVYHSFYHSEVYQKMKNMGKKYVFISNCDNLGATVNYMIAKIMQENKLDFCLEVVNKTLADVKGGTFIIDNNNIKLLEVAQVPKEHLDEFYNIEKFKFFNTNNLWIDIDKFATDITMEVIYNPKKVDDIAVVQLEVAMGSAVQSFENSKIILVGRDRFRPVKKFKDLYLLQSKVFKLNPEYNLITTENIPEFDFDMSIKSMEKYLKYIEGKTFF